LPGSIQCLRPEKAPLDVHDLVALAPAKARDRFIGNEGDVKSKPVAVLDVLRRVERERLLVGRPSAALDALQKDASFAELRFGSKMQPQPRSS
jgi:hypothetical protein